jgi:hypothetical protein
LAVGFFFVLSLLASYLYCVDAVVGKKSL